MLKHHLDPNNHNGAVFLGLNGIVVKSHGSANALGVANAVAVAARLVEDKLIERISDDLARLGGEGVTTTGPALTLLDGPVDGVDSSPTGIASGAMR